MTVPASSWQYATVLNINAETPTAKSYRLRLDEPAPHLAGQHYLVRLTAPDGYSAVRSFSIASPPLDPRELCLTVERMEGGEVSNFLHDVVEPGDRLEVRGPIGEWFVWRGAEPAILIGGGSGIVPLMSMLRLARYGRRSNLLKLVVSARSPERLLFSRELEGPETTIVFTRAARLGDQRRPGRLRAEDLPSDLARFRIAYVCGPSGFTDHAGDLLIGAGMPPTAIRVETFGAGEAVAPDHT